MVSDKVRHQWVKEGLGWWADLVRLEMEFDIECQYLKVAACFDGLCVLVADSVREVELRRDRPYQLFSSVGKRIAVAMNDYSERRFGYVPRQGR